MAHLFSPYTLQGVTLRNRIAMSPMTMYRSHDGHMGDFHLMHLGARAAGGFGLVFGEQIAVCAEGRTSVHCAGLWRDDQVPGHARTVAMVEAMGGVAGIQLAHTGRKGSEQLPWEGKAQLPPEHPDGWLTSGPSPVPFGGPKHDHAVHELTVAEIHGLHRAWADAARRAAEAGYRWMELHFAHGYLGSSFFSPISNRRTDAYGGSLENRARFLLEALDAVRGAWPEEYPLTMRLGADDLHPDGTTFDDAVTAIGWMREHGLDLADLSFGGNTPDSRDAMRGEQGAWVDRARRIRAEIGIPVAASWNLGVPQTADEAVRSGALDVVLLGRPALANPHWPVWAARELGHDDPFSLVPDDYAWWLRNMRGHTPSIGWPEPRVVR
ncbi:NADH:flavin oxidoreductase/NADH oxidase [Pseudonocardia sp. DR1-2]|uniref:NADH:flavin oxidoreductase/NADH oxidase n=1 Tax=Pseudonocardia sp. DR1-2 TaxID=2951168 RepID=UPI00255AA028|nr:NADH:flavin oxidoreductase/NADH oxidase [Pseudonocardia sp. DR1-2]